MYGMEYSPNTIFSGTFLLFCVSTEQKQKECFVFISVVWQQTVNINIYWWI